MGNTKLQHMIAANIPQTIIQAHAYCTFLAGWRDELGGLITPDVSLIFSVLFLAKTMADQNITFVRACVRA